MARANGKLILFGEHAVVHGSPAIAAGIQRGAVATAHRAQASSLRFGERRAQAGDGSELIAALDALLGALDLGPHALEVELELPPGAGLGASAALGVAIARAVLEASGEAPSVERALAGAGAWEHVFHGNPSGIDAAAASYGGCLLFSRAEGVKPLRLACDLSIVVAISGPAASTRAMVEAVEALRRRRPEIVDKTVAGVRALVENARLALEAGDLPALGRLMDLNQMLLSGLLVSTEGIERACTLAREAGALGAKLTGAGGGGAVIALCEDPAPILAAYRGAGIEAFETTVAARAPGSEP